MKNDRRIKHLVSQLHKRKYRDIESWTHDDELVDRGFISEDQRIRRLTARMLLTSKCDEGIFNEEMINLIDVWIDWITEEPARKPESMGKEYVPIPSTKIFRDSSWHAFWKGKEIYLREDATESNARYALALSQKFGFAISPWCAVRFPDRATCKYVWNVLNNTKTLDDLKKLFFANGVISFHKWYSQYPRIDQAS